MKYKIVADSSCNIVSGEDSTFASVPMKIVAEREYVDDANLDVAQMVEDLKQYKGKSGSSCPNVGEWLEAFGDAEEVFGITISKHLSGSYNAARHAADTYMAEHPERKVFIFDSLATGPEMMMLAQKIRQCEDAGDDFETTKEKVLDYHNHLHTLFCLESMNNLARNGRVNIAVAKIAGMLGIRVAGEAKGGQVAPVHKPRGLRKPPRCWWIWSGSGASGTADISASPTASPRKRRRISGKRCWPSSPMPALCWSRRRLCAATMRRWAA